MNSQKANSNTIRSAIKSSNEKYAKRSKNNINTAKSTNKINISHPNSTKTINKNYKPNPETVGRTDKQTDIVRTVRRNTYNSIADNDERSSRTHRNIHSSSKNSRLIASLQDYPQKHHRFTSILDVCDLYFKRVSLNREETLQSTNQDGNHTNSMGVGESRGQNTINLTNTININANIISHSNIASSNSQIANQNTIINGIFTKNDLLQLYDVKQRRLYDLLSILEGCGWVRKNRGKYYHFEGQSIIQLYNPKTKDSSQGQSDNRHPPRLSDNKKTQNQQQVYPRHSQSMQPESFCLIANQNIQCAQIVGKYQQLSSKQEQLSKMDEQQLIPFGNRQIHNTINIIRQDTTCNSIINTPLIGSINTPLQRSLNSHLFTDSSPTRCFTPILQTGASHQNCSNNNTHSLASINNNQVNDHGIQLSSIHSNSSNLNISPMLPNTSRFQLCTTPRARVMSPTLSPSSIVSVDESVNSSHHNTRLDERGQDQRDSTIKNNNTSHTIISKPLLISHHSSYGEVAPLNSRGLYVPTVQRISRDESDQSSLESVAQPNNQSSSHSSIHRNNHRTNQLLSVKRITAKIRDLLESHQLKLNFDQLESHLNFDQLETHLNQDSNRTHNNIGQTKTKSTNSLRRRVYDCCKVLTDIQLIVKKGKKYQWIANHYQTNNTWRLGANQLGIDGSRGIQNNDNLIPIIRSTQISLIPNSSLNQSIKHKQTNINQTYDNSNNTNNMSLQYLMNNIIQHYCHSQFDLENVVNSLRESFNRINSTNSNSQINIQTQLKENNQ